MAFLAVIFALLFLLIIGLEVGWICVDEESHFIMAIGFVFALLITSLALLVSSLRKPATPPEPRVINALLQTYQRKFRPPLSFTKKTLVVLSVVMLVQLYIVISADYCVFRPVMINPMFYFIMSVSFGFVFLLAMLAQLASSLRHPDSQTKPWIALAKFLALQRRGQLAALAALVALEASIAAVVFWECVPPLLTFEGPMYSDARSDPIAERRFDATVLEAIEQIHPLRLIPAEWAFHYGSASFRAWANKEAAARSSLIVLLWCFVVGGEAFFYMRRIAVRGAEDVVSPKPTP
ncbi:MAG: hypothetical protein NT105_11055 [Verrucomicrobia bacterium]|nr:hypothetical protein [Verrucomicrobiota bacterium]